MLDTLPLMIFKPPPLTGDGVGRPVALSITLLRVHPFLPMSGPLLFSETRSVTAFLLSSIVHVIGHETSSFLLLYHRFRFLSFLLLPSSFSFIILLSNVLAFENTFPFLFLPFLLLSSLVLFFLPYLLPLSSLWGGVSLFFPPSSFSSTFFSGSLPSFLVFFLSLMWGGVSPSFLPPNYLFCRFVTIFLLLIFFHSYTTT